MVDPGPGVKGLVVPPDAYIVPIAGRIVVQLQAVREAMYGNLYLPQQSAGDQSVGQVLQVYEPYVDDYNNTIEPTVKVGDIVVIGKYTGTEVQLNRQTVIICREMDVLGLIRIPQKEGEASA